MDDEVADEVRFQLPVAIGQRYGTVPTSVESAASASSRTRLRITADIQMSGRLQNVKSPTHVISLSPYKTHLGRVSHRRTTAKFRSATFLEHDFVLVVRADGLDAPRCFVERDLRPEGLETIAMQLTIVPKFKLPPIPAQEFIFVVDRSGSMSGLRIETAKRTLNILLRMLPGAFTTFNIFSFGSKADSLWPSSPGYTQDTLDYAVNIPCNLISLYF
jgi:von Willebrand factor type A domain